MRRRTLPLVALALYCLGAAAPNRQWVLASDIHLDPVAAGSVPASYGKDANQALLTSAIDEMRRAAPNPEVVVLNGDFLAHHFHGDAVGTMRAIARQFDRAFPHARFLISLGNNDDPCGDYRVTENSPYLRDIAPIWAPLVDRDGASPDFAHTFSQGGYYIAKLPEDDEEAVVLNSVYWSANYRDACGPARQTPDKDEFAWLSATLSDAPPQQKNIVFMHVPLGVDAFSTAFVHGATQIRFFNDADGEALRLLLRGAGNHVTEVIAGHTHRAEARTLGTIPMIILGAISPIYRTDPTFVVETVGPTGKAIAYRTYDYIEASHRWASRPALHPYAGDKYAVCAQTNVVAERYAKCAGIVGISAWGWRIATVVVALAVVVGLILAGVWYARRR
jgi:hypothetical protein